MDPETKSSCCDMLASLLPFAAERFAPGYTENGNRKKLALSYCDLLDWLANRYEGEPFQVRIDDDTREIFISILFEDFIIEKEDYKFYSVVQYCTRFGVQFQTENSLRMTFVLDGIWDKKE